jgi:DNA-binding MarR family transcriptional regulator
MAMEHEQADDLDEVWARVGIAMREVWFAGVEHLNLSPPLAGAINALESPIPMRDLAERFQCDASYITSIADRLEERGLAERRADQSDRRIKLLALTPAGEAMHRTLQRLHVPAMDRLSEKERTTLAKLLTKAFAQPNG